MDADPERWRCGTRPTVPHSEARSQLRFTGHEDVSDAGLAQKNGMCSPDVRQGPEGRLPNIAQPGRAGTSMEADPERWRCGTRPTVPNSEARSQLRFTGHEDVSDAGLAQKNGMCSPDVRQGPEGRLPNIAQPGRVGTSMDADPERRRCGTRPTVPSSEARSQLRFTGHEDVSDAGLAQKNGMCSPDVRQGPEGRPPNIAQPGRAGISMDADPERRRCGTR